MLLGDGLGVRRAAGCWVQMVEAEQSAGRWSASYCTESTSFRGIWLNGGEKYGQVQRAISLQVMLWVFALGLVSLI